MQGRILRLKNTMNNKKNQTYLKLLAVGFLFVWLFIVSPLNPLYKGYSSKELFFINLSFGYWIAVTVFVLWMMFFINKKNYEYHLSKIFGVGIFLYYLFFIPFGFDITETGLHLSKQFFLFDGAWKEGFDEIAGTNLVGGLWLLISKCPFLIWARVGFSLVQAMIMYFSFRILILYFNPLKVFFAGLVPAVSLSFWQYYHTVNFENLPLLFLLAAVYFILKQIKSTECNQKFNMYASGVFIVLSVFCKILYFPALILIPLASFRDTERRKEMLKGYLIGLVSGIAFLVLLMLFTGSLSIYSRNIFNLISDSLSGSMLYFKYKLQFTQIITNVVYLSFMTLLLSYVYSRIRKNKLVKSAAYCILVWIFYYSVFEPKPSEGIITFSLTLSLIWLISEKVEKIGGTYELMLVSLIVFVVSFMGSDPCISSGLRSGSAFLPVTASILLISDSEVSFGKIFISFKYIFGLSILIFFLFFLQDEFRPYQDFKYDFLSETFKSPQLLGIKSNPDRVAVVDSLLSYLNDIPDIKDRDIYFAKHSPMYYYLTGTKYRLDSPWDTLNKLEDIKADFYRQAPEMIVMSKGSHRNHMWPNEQKGWEETAAEVKVKPYYEFYDSFIKENNYIEVYKNSFYTVYGLGDEGKENEQITE